MIKSIVSKEYQTFFEEVKNRIKAAQYEALKAVNKELMTLYWDIGKMIAERQRRLGWGAFVVEHLAVDLLTELPGVHGFSITNLRLMRQFYLEYASKPKLQPLVGEIGWSKNIIILTRCKDDLEREFYIRMTRKMGWTKSVLIHQIENQTFEKTMINQTNFKKALPVDLHRQALLAVKDEYTFDFLELADRHSERELEHAILARMERFLREMGGQITFAGSQFPLKAGKKEYAIDLLLYHRFMKCLIAIDLKVGEFEPEHVGKMQFYLAALDDKVKMKDENPSIGIIVCKEKDRTIVEYALKQSNKPIGVTTYSITKTLPKNLRKLLPGKKQIELLIEGLKVESDPFAKSTGK